MNTILVTGATGNVGLEVIHSLYAFSMEFRIIAAVRDINRSKEKFVEYPNIYLRPLDFEKPDTFKNAFNEIDILFLLRPPHISDVKKIFKPLLESAKESSIKKVVFLSVQGAERSRVIPHNKIERIIKEMGFSYIFIRPGYFMQNLTTTLRKELVENHSLTLPAGKAKFIWVDVKNIGEAATRLLVAFNKHKGRAFEITGSEKKNFQEVIDLLSKTTGKEFRYQSINPISYYFKKRKQGLNSGYALVMTALHFLPRIQSEPNITDNYQKLTGKEPTTLQQFIERGIHHFTS